MHLLYTFVLCICSKILFYFIYVSFVTNVNNRLADLPHIDYRTTIAAKNNFSTVVHRDMNITTSESGSSIDALQYEDGNFEVGKVYNKKNPPKKSTH